jgi:hypothetical protein
MNNFEKIKAMDIDEMAELFVTCINSGEVVADLEYTSPVLPDIYYDSKKCVQDTKQWLESEVRE